MRSPLLNPRGLYPRLRSALFALGIEARRVPRLARFDRQLRTDGSSATGWIIELVGSSAVGKSTFVEYLRETARPEDAFVVLPRKFRVHRRSKSKAQWNESDRRWLDLWARHQEINEFPWIDPCEIDTQKSRVLRDERTIRTFEALRPLVVDHSLALFFHTTLRSLAEDRGDLFDDLLSRRVVIVCRADPAVILDRIRQRTARGVTRASHIGRSDEELLERLRLNTWMNWGELLASRGIPVLVLDLGSPLGDSKTKLQEFIRSLARV
jgi:hypothetical protein